MNRLTHLTATKIPLIQAPMAGVQDARLAVAVSTSGALGSLPCAMLSLDALHQALTALAGTRLPVNLNFFCHQDLPADPAQQIRWQHTLRPYLTHYQLDPQKIGISAGRQPFSAAHLAVLREFRPGIVSFHFGLPAAPLVDELKSWGTIILSSATTVEEALYLQKHGADIIIAQGSEAGGHRGMFLTDDPYSQSGTLALLPQIIDAVTVPVVAAGGIADDRAVRAVMALGAAGVQVGTSYLLCPEALTSPLQCQALADPSRSTAITNIFTGRPARGIVNFAIETLGAIHPDTPDFPYAAPVMAALRAAAETQGKADFTPLFAGQNRRGCKPVPAAELTKQMAAGFAETFQG